VTEGRGNDRGERGHAGHEHLSHVPDATRPAVFAARAVVRTVTPAHGDQLESDVTAFLAALSDGLAEAGCRLVGHVKGSIAAVGRGDLTFHVTALGSAPAITGGFAGMVEEAELTINVIVFGVDERELPAIVRGAWSRASHAVAVWRG